MRYSDYVRNRILDAAEAEFLAHGYAGASTNRVLKVIGGSKATMFRRFQTKEAMFAIVVERIATGMMTNVSLANVASDSPAEGLTRFGRAVLLGVMADRALSLMRLVFAEGDRFPEARDNFVRISVLPLVHYLEERLTAWAGDGLLVTIDPARDAQHFIGLAATVRVNWALLGLDPHPSVESLHAHIDSAVGLFLEGRLPRAH